MVLKSIVTFWFADAVEADKFGAVHTCQSIIPSFIGVSVEEEDRKLTWIDNADNCAKDGAFKCATDFSIEKEYLVKSYFEKSHGTRESLEALIQRTVAHCPKSEILW